MSNGSQAAAVRPANTPAAAADPDARPMPVGELRAARRVPRVKTLRRALGFTQEEFAARYQIPLGTT